MFVLWKSLILYTLLIFQFANDTFGNHWKIFVLKLWQPFICIRVRISSEKHLLVSRFTTSVRSSARLSICLSVCPSVCLSVCLYQLVSNKWLSRNLILGTLRKSVERLQIWLKSEKKYISLYMKTFMLTAVKNGTDSCVFMTRLIGFILFTVTCQQQYEGDHSCFSIAKNVVAPVHHTATYREWRHRMLC
jgi:hypothetical protein